MGYMENRRVQEKSAEMTALILADWKHKVKKLRIYKLGLWVALTVSCLALSGVTYYKIDSSIPSVIRLRADEQQSFELGVPARGKIVSVSENGASTIPRDKISIDLSREVTMKMEQDVACEMQVNLFGVLPIKKVGIQVIGETELIPVGKPVGIYVKTDGILVIGTGEFKGKNGITYSPGKNIVKSGDYIQKINGEEVDKKVDFIQKVRDCKGEPVNLQVLRGEEELELKIQPKKDESGEYKIGVWVRDSAQGVGTMTYIDAEGRFGALGHGITDVDTSTLMQTTGGTLYDTEIVDIKKGEIGTPGEMTGMIVYSQEHVLGKVTENSVRGIFGECNERTWEMTNNRPLPIALKQEIKKGPAQILCTLEDEPDYYDIEITDVKLDNNKINRGIEVKVKDERLLKKTGGIVQGMSGSPIIQDGKIIGAVTHVLVQDSTRGYGIFIENMLND